jgi:hypothetical protein
MLMVESKAREGDVDVRLPCLDEIACQYCSGYCGCKCIKGFCECTRKPPVTHDNIHAPAPSN